MKDRNRLRKIIAPIALGIGLAVGASTEAIAHPRHSDYYGGYHQRSLRNVQPFRSLNVTPKYYIPRADPPYGYRGYDRDYHLRGRFPHRDDGRYSGRERRVFRRGFRAGDRNNRHDRYDDYYPESDRYIRIRVR